jgi:16S rRNA processing protein RimM
MTDSLSQDEEWTILAQLLRPQGRKGELLADLHADPELLAAGSPAFLASPGFTGPERNARQVDITSAWMPNGRNRGRIVVHFAGVASISEAELLSGLAVMIPRSSRPEPEEGAEYVEDLVGCQVYDGDTLVGTLDAIEFSTDPDGKRLVDAAPLLSVVTAQGDEILIPYVQQFLESVSTEAREIRMRLPEGLLDLNQRTAHS